MKDYSCVVDCYIYTAYYSHFNKSYSWQGSYFELLSWKNTWDLCYDIDILSSRKNGAFLRLIVKATGNKDTQERVMEMLDDLGYRDVDVEQAKARVFDPNDIWENDLDNDIYEYFFD